MSQFPAFSFAGLDDFEPWAGGGHQMVDREGYYPVKIDSAVPKASKDPTRPMANIGFVITDPEVNTGKHLMDSVIYAGVDTKGKGLNRQFAQVISSTGTPKENIQAHGKSKTSFPIEQVLQTLVGREGYVEIKFKSYEGNPSCEITNWVTKEVYEKVKANNGHHGRAESEVNWAQLAALETENKKKQGAGGQPQFGGAGAFTVPQLGGVAYAAPGAPAAAPAQPGLPFGNNAAAPAATAPAGQPQLPNF